MPASAPCQSRPALLLIDLQQAIDHPSWGQRNQVGAETQAARLLARWRQLGWPVLHVRHLSRESDSTYRPDKAGALFKPEFCPLPDEPIFTKSAHAAFVGTGLGAWLQGHGVRELVLAGVITDNSVEATARMASDLGFDCVVVSDACFTFGRADLEGRFHDAHTIHALSLGRLQGEYANVLETAVVLMRLAKLGSGAEASALPAPRDELARLPLARRWRQQAHPAAVVGVLLKRVTPDGEAKLLLKRNHPPYAGLWSLPGGKWEFGETLAEAALREAREETGLEAEFVGMLALLDECLCPAEGAAQGAHFLLHLCALRAPAGALAASREGEVRWFNDREIAALADAGAIVPSDFRMLDVLHQLGGVGHFEAEVAVDGQGAATLLRFVRRA